MFCRSLTQKEGHKTQESIDIWRKGLWIFTFFNVTLFINFLKYELDKMQLLCQINKTVSGTRLTDKTKSNQGLLTHYTDNIWS